ncbi:response regulator transcription factor [Saccharopolyspora sp. ASAGF58]|uniref:response regulator transcription factor n=1 Tax=Saccharopolyspora sp. ASAGF58 TaxID=2719023 RepID=UPI00143FD6A4|nr:helix-turn-helix transcriptional regulator [Saccharopolyspora sp. ASAGF58]
MRNSPQRFSTDELINLTKGERDVIYCIACELTDSEIAMRLFISKDTVKSRLGGLYRKFNLRNRVGAVILGYELGILKPSNVEQFRNVESSTSDHTSRICLPVRQQDMKEMEALVDLLARRVKRHLLTEAM